MNGCALWALTNKYAAAYPCRIARQSQQSVSGEFTAKSNAYLLRTIRMVYESLLVTPLSEGRLPVILHCARRTTTALSWGFREHRGLLEPPFASHALGSQDHTGFPPIYLSPSTCSLKGWPGLVPHCAHRGSTVSPCALCEHMGVHQASPLY